MPEEQSVNLLSDATTILRSKAIGVTEEKDPMRAGGWGRRGETVDTDGPKWLFL